MEQAVYWTEYVIRHKGAPHLRSAVLDLAWYQYFLLDVIAVLALVAVCVLMAVYFMSRAIISRLSATRPRIAGSVVKKND
jgi:glucuronosyltransferase